jgi:bacterioferritin B
MLISKKMNAALNQQIGNEFGASLQYVAIACHFAGDGLDALADHFFKQANEERQHAMRFVKYLLHAGGHVEIPAIPAAKSTFKNAAEAVKLSLDWELVVTQQINDLVNLAIKESDHLAHSMLTWFVKEQLEEVSSMDNLLKVVQRAGENNLIHVEQYLLRLRRRAEEAEVEADKD